MRGGAIVRIVSGQLATLLGQNNFDCIIDIDSLIDLMLYYFFFIQFNVPFKIISLISIRENR